VTDRLWAIDPASYSPPCGPPQRPHLAESNCSVDVWIGIAHTAGLEPMAVLPCTIAIDFEGDQWTLLQDPLR
jgi:hypothetical protein